MGMFDTFGVAIPCEKCGIELLDFQSKDLDCVMAYYRFGHPIMVHNGSVTKTISGEINIYTPCEECKHWNEFVAVSNDGIFNEVRDKDGKIIKTISHIESIKLLEDRLGNTHTRLIMAKETRDKALALLVCTGNEDLLKLCNVNNKSRKRILGTVEALEHSRGVAYVGAVHGSARGAINAYKETKEASMTDVLEQIALEIIDELNDETLYIERFKGGVSINNDKLKKNTVIIMRSERPGLVVVGGDHSWTEHDQNEPDSLDTIKTAALKHMKKPHSD